MASVPALGDTVTLAPCCRAPWLLRVLMDGAREVTWLSPRAVPGVTPAVSSAGRFPEQQCAVTRRAAPEVH